MLNETTKDWKRTDNKKRNKEGQKVNKGNGYNRH